jgi:poly(hydroxyalkanoate) granule-associated protein
MVTKVKRGDAAASPSADKRTASQLADTVKESASQIWLAGLGAFSKAQEEGGKVFETLVKEGLSIQRKTQAVAEDKLSEATNRMAGMATELSSKASGQWDKLESIFEARVSKAMARLGVPSAAEVQALIDRVEALQRSVDALGGKTAAPRARKTAAKAAKPAPAKAPRKSAARKAA